MKLVVFGDYHYTSDKNYNEESKYYDFTQEFIDLKNDFHEFSIKEIFKEEADYYISLGDLTNYGRKDEYEDIYKMIEGTGKKDRFIQILGNHDVLSYTAKEVSDLIGQDYNYSIEEDEAKMIFFFSSAEKDPDKWGGIIDEYDAEFLLQEIEQVKDKTLLIFSHHPVYDTVLGSRFDNMHIAPPETMREVLDSYKGTGVFFAAHNHSESIEQIGNWTYVNIDCFLDHPKYSIVEIDGEYIDIKSVEVDLSEKLEESRQIIRKLMYRFYPMDYNRGTSPNKERKIKIIK